MARTRQTIDDLLGAYPAIDGLVLGARYFRAQRSVTSEGFEDNFALYYLSRYLLGYGLLDALGRAEHPVVVNVAGPGSDNPIDWDDLQSARQYDGVRAMFTAGRLNDLLGVAFAERHGASGVRYVLFHPGSTSTGFAGDYDPQTAAFIEQMKAQSKPAGAVVPPLLRLLDDPPGRPLTAFHLDDELSVHGPLFSPESAARLAGITADLLDRTTA